MQYEQSDYDARPYTNGFRSSKWISIATCLDSSRIDMAVFIDLEPFPAANKRNPYNAGTCSGESTITPLNSFPSLRQQAVSLARLQSRL